MKWLIIPATMLLLIFIPIKVKIKAIYEDNEFMIYIFNKRINIQKAISKCKPTPETSKIFKKMLDKFNKKNIMTTISNLSNNKFKPKIKQDYDIDYGFDDAAVTGIVYGLLQNVSFIIYKLTSILFKVKDYKFKPEPHFNDSMLKFRITSIISVNLAQIIYMLKIIYFK